MFSANISMRGVQLQIVYCGLKINFIVLQVDFLPSKALTPEELERQRLALEARSRALRNVVTVVDGNQANFEIMIDATYK